MCLKGLPSGFPVVVSDRTYFHCDTAAMDGESKRVLEYLTEVEVAAEDVLTTKQQVTKNHPSKNKIVNKLRLIDASSYGTLSTMLAPKLNS